MATLTFMQSFDPVWFPNVLAGGDIVQRQSGRMTYISEAGYTITLRGANLAYDDDGIPSAGTVSSVQVAKAGVTYCTITGTTMDFAVAGMRLFGFTAENGYVQSPDGFGALQYAMIGNDMIMGSDTNDDIRGGAGNDTIIAGGGGDYIGNEQGNDVMDGGDGWDTLSFDEGNWGHDAIRGIDLDVANGIATDTWGFTDRFSNFEHYKDSAFSDTLRGSDADFETFNINRGNDFIDGRSGTDMVNYNEALRWGAHRGVVVNLDAGFATDSWRGTDTLINVEGVQGSTFNDRITGSAADETFLGNQGVDTIYGGGGNDTLGFWEVDWSGVGHGVTVNLAASKNVLDDGYGNVETAVGIESVHATKFGDRLTGDAGMNQLWGNEGNDTIAGGSGEDELSGGDGRDRVVAGAGNDHIDGDRDSDTLTGNTGFDQFNFQSALTEGGTDTITDFEHGIDHIWISSNWGGGLVLDHLQDNQFRAGAGVSTANTADQRVIYNTSTGDLYFDPDGNGAQAATKFAILSNLAALSFDDLAIFV